jgi:hypothetical protein
MLLAACAAAGLLAACGKRARPAIEASGDAISPVVRGAEAGLESHLWVVENGGGSLARAMRSFGPPATAAPAAVELWRRNGFRVLEVPVARLDELRESLLTIGPLHRQWLGMLPEWVEVVKGAQLAGERPVALDNGPVRLGPGRLRLVSRCWPVPSVGARPDGSAAGAVLRLEVMPELEMKPQGVPLERLLEEPDPQSRAGVHGIAFDRLLLGVVASGESAIVIVPEEPGVDWTMAAEERPEGDAREGVVFGPRAPETPTLGALMLTSLALPESAGDARIVVVLVPRAPQKFELLPR